MAHSWCSSRFRSEAPVRRRLAGLVLLVSACGPLAAASQAHAANVTGTVRVDRATFRADGPKHDRDVVIILDRVGGPPPPMAAERYQMDQKGMTFVPHVLAIQKGSTVTFLNNDREQHNVYFLEEQTGKTLDIGTYGPGVSTEHRFTTPGVVVALCKLHLEMAAYIITTDSPWFATAQLDAAQPAPFTLKDVPPGEYRVTVWHKKLKPLGLPERLVVPKSGSVDLPVVLTTAARAKKGQ